MIPELSRKIRADGIPPGGTEFSVDATAEECAAIAVRLQIPGIAALSCRYRLQPTTGGRISATARLVAQLTRVCVVTLDEFPTAVEDDSALVFVPADLASDDDDPDTPDEIPFEHGIIDLGETTTEQLALALEPYPRKPGAELDPSAGEAPASPFAGLAQLRRPN